MFCLKVDHVNLICFYTIFFWCVLNLLFNIGAYQSSNGISVNPPIKIFIVSELIHSSSDELRSHRDWGSIPLEIEFSSRFYTNVKKIHCIELYTNSEVQPLTTQQPAIWHMQHSNVQKHISHILAKVCDFLVSFPFSQFSYFREEWLNWNILFLPSSICSHNGVTTILVSSLEESEPC